MLVQHRREQFCEGSSEEYFEFEYDEEKEADDVESDFLKNETSIRLEFRDESWKNPNFMFDPMLRPFFRFGRGPTFLYNTPSTFSTLFELFQANYLGQHCE